MAKLSKNVLKEIVKECIIEIFEESFFAGKPIISESRDAIENSQIAARKSRPRPVQQRSKHLDNISYNSNAGIQEAKANNFEKKIEKITSNITNDPIMANIFKDTASTTLQQQIESSKPTQVSVLGGGDAAAKKAYSSDPTELFAESASKWATLAFSESVRK